MNQAADLFGAEGKFLSAGKKLLDTSHPAFKVVTAIKGRCLSYWRAVSLLGLFATRTDALTAEINLLQAHWLTSPE